MKIYTFLLIATLIQFPSFAQHKKFACSAREEASDEGLRSAYDLFSTSGNIQIDQATLRELTLLQQCFLVSPVFFFYDDIDGKNAQATNEVLNPVNGPDGTVIFGKRMFNREFVRSYGGTTIPIIIAHEYAHIVDLKYGVLEHKSPKQRELFADVFAGMYMYVRSSIRYYTDLNAVYQCFTSLGDTEFGAIDHHGTSQERTNAVFAGYSFMQARANQGIMYTPLNVAIEAAKQYVDQFNEH